MSQLVFTSHWICFYYIMICPVYQHTPLVLFRLHDLDALAVDFEQVIISVILFTVMFTNQIMIFFTSAVHVPLVLSCLLNPSALTADFEQVIFPVICFLVICFLSSWLTRYWFVSCRQHMCHQFCLFCIDGVLADFEPVIVPVLLYFVLFCN